MINVFRVDLDDQLQRYLDDKYNILNSSYLSSHELGYVEGLTNDIKNTKTLLETNLLSDFPNPRELLKITGEVNPKTFTDHRPVLQRELQKREDQRDSYRRFQREEGVSTYLNTAISELDDRIAYLNKKIRDADELSKRY